MGMKLHQAGLSYAKGRISRGKVDHDSEWSFGDEERNELLGEGTLKDFGLWHLGEDPDQGEDSPSRFLFAYGRAGKVHRHALADIVLGCKKGRTKAKKAGGRKAQEDIEGFDTIEREAKNILDLLDKKKANSQQFLPLGDPAKPFGVILADPAYAVCAEDMDMVQGGGMRGWTQIARTGKFLGHWQGPFTLTDDMLAVMQVNHERFVNALPFDYGHEAVWNAAFIASGWGHEMKLARNGETLFELVEWTPKAAKHIIDGEYKYISPVILFETPDPFTGEDLGPSIWTVALLNTPFLKDMDPVEVGRQVAASAQKLNFAPPGRIWAGMNPTPDPTGSENSATPPEPEPTAEPEPEPEDVMTTSTHTEDDTMSMKEIALSLGLPETATVDEIKKAILAKDAAAGLGAQAAEAKALADQKAAEAKAAQDRVAQLEREKKERELKEAKDLTEAYIKAGRIAPASRERACKMAIEDRESFYALYGKEDEPGRAVVPMGAVASADPASSQISSAPTGAATLTDEDREVMERMKVQLGRVASAQSKRFGRPVGIEEVFLAEKKGRQERKVLGRTFACPDNVIRTDR